MKNHSRYRPNPGLLTLLCITCSPAAWSGAEVIPIPPENVTASSEISAPFDRQDDFIVDGSGLEAGQHTAAVQPNMWLSTGTGFGGDDPDPSVTFDLGAFYTITGFHVWNYNESPPNLTGRGVNSVTVEYGSTPALGSTLSGVTSFAEADGTASYTGEEFNSFPPFNARFIKFDIHSNHGGDNNFYGLSEVQFQGSLGGIDLSADGFVTSVNQGDRVGTLTTRSATAGDRFSYTLTPGDGDTDNSKFQIVGNELQIGAHDFRPAADGSVFSVRVRSTGSPSGDQSDEVFTLTASADADADGLLDTWEEKWAGAGNLTVLSGLGDNDRDGDTLTDLQEYDLRNQFPNLNPTLADSDNDTLDDGEEIAGAGARPPTDPTLADTDSDTLDDAVESNTGSFVGPADTGTDPTVADTDGDSLSDGAESNTGRFVDLTDTGSNPLLADTDDDTFNDNIEVARGSDPSDAGSKPSTPSVGLDRSASSPDAVVVFNEVHYNPRGASESAEWVELFNQMGIMTDISGWRIDGLNYIFPPDTFIDPGSFLVVAKSPTAGQLGPFTGSLDNGGERLRLINRGDRLMDELDFSDGGRWPAAADGSGATLAKRHPDTANSPAGNWTTSQQLGGTPGEHNFPNANTPNAPQLAFNEIPAATDDNFWLELINHGTTPVTVDGMTVSAAADPERTFPLPAGQLQPGTRLLLEQATLGFRPSDGEKLFLYNSEGTSVLDARQVTGRLRGRSPSHGARWLYPSVATPNAPNTFAFNTSIVISEIAYNPPALPPSATNSNNQWIELANRSTAPVDLTGWDFGDGISFEFPAGTLLAPREHACIVRNPSGFNIAFPGARILGEFSGSLSRSGELLQLRDSAKNPADEVRYYDSGRWPETADGGGSTLELRDLDADNNIGESWGTSDETAQTGWKNYTYSGRLTASRGPDSKWSEFNLGMLAAGEILIDDIDVIENGSTQKIPNTDFSGGATDWRFRGTHRHSEVIDDPDDPGNKVLRLVATGGTGHMHNQIETTLIRPARNGLNYEISFRAKWVSGSNQLHTRLYFNRLPHVTRIDRPQHVGTPSAPNSSAENNIGPSITGTLHSPAVPDVNQPVIVTARADDPDTVANVQLFYSVNGAGFQNVPMAAGADGTYQASVPGQQAAAVVQFYVQASDSLGASSTFPAAGPGSRALYKVDDGLAATNGQHNFRIVVTNAERDFLHEPIEVMGNGRIGCTIIDREQDVYYDVKLRLKGSERARFQRNRVGYNMRFGADQLYRGVHSSLAIDRSEGVGQGQIEILFDFMIANSGGVVSRYYDFIKVLAPKNEHTRSAVLQMARYDNTFLDSQFENGSDGNLYEYELLYTPNNADRNGFKLPNSDGVTGVTVSDLGDDKEKYRWFFLKKNNREADDFAPIIAYNKKFSQSGEAFENGLEEVVDIDGWFRGMAYAALSGAGDNAGANSQHNGMYYAHPDGRVMFLPHDMDFAFDSGRSVFANSQCSKLTRNGERRRIYLGHLHDIISTTYNNSYMARWTRHLQSFDPSQNWSAHLRYINSRSNNVLRSQISRSIRPVDFAITSPSPLTVNGSTATVSGDGWIDVRNIRIAGGGDLDVTWTGSSSWQLDLPVQPGQNTFTLQAIDFSGTVIDTRSITVNNTSTVEPASKYNLVISELMYHPPVPTPAEVAAGFQDKEHFEFIELTNIGTREVNLGGTKFTSGINHDLPDVTIPPRTSVVLARDRAALLNRYPTIGSALLPGEYATGDTNKLSHDGEQLILASSDETDIRRFTYNDQTPWPTSADGGGFSLVLVAAASNPDHSIPENWRNSGSINGTPGTSEATTFSGDPDGDDDGDGVNNFLDYALGNSPSPAFSTASGGALVFEFHRNLLAEDVIVTVESSSNLTDWDSAEVVLNSAVSLGDGRELQTWSLDPSTAQPLFLRVNAAQR